MRQLRLLLGLLVSLLATQALSKKDKPDIEETAFDAPPLGLTYFEDSDIILVTHPETQVVYRSSDAGVKWTPIKDITEGEALETLKHPYDKKTAVVLGTKKKHWITSDRGESWREFTTDEGPTKLKPGIVFHATDPDRMLFLAQNCRAWRCTDSVYYTTDGFKEKPKAMPDDILDCIWAKNADVFAERNKDLEDDTVLCMAAGKFSLLHSNMRVVVSKDFFEKDPVEPKSDDRPVEGVVNIAATKGYLVIAAKGERTSEMAMYVSDDIDVWHRAEFGEHRLEEGAYTLLESTNYSMQVDVMTTRPSSLEPMGVLLTSNSNGTYFTRNVEHTNRDIRGFVDFEKIANIQGVALVNTVENYEEVERRAMVSKEIVTQISFDDGRTWGELGVDGKRLHLHSITEQRNMGRMFSSPAPGIVMGVGNTGKVLKKYSEGDLYISDDTGVTWKLALEKPHLFEFGAQGSILVAVEDGETDELRWSMDHGKTWEKVDLPSKVKPMALTTTPDSTSLKFLMIAAKGGGSGTKYNIYAIDFNGVHERECKDKDYEDWQARVDGEGKPVCIMGHTQSFKRRKPDAECFVPNKDFQDPEENRKTCKCTEQDFECDYNFKRHEGKCVQSGKIVPPKGTCEGEDKKYKGSSGYRKIPGNDCEGGVNLAEETERDCSETAAPPASGQISNEITKFKGDEFVEYYYLERDGNPGDDETIIMRTELREVFKTHDHGKSWIPVLKEEEVLAIYPHQYQNDRVYLVTPSKKVYFSTDFAKNFHSFDAPEEPNRAHVQVLTFHPKEKDWLIWTGGRDCKGDQCLTVAQVSRKHGESWETMLRAVRKCQFVYREDRENSDSMVLCEQYENENENKEGASRLLVSSTDWFEHKQEVKRDVIAFATMAEYIVVAFRAEEKETLKVDASIDGVTFADAQFPPNFEVPHQHAYTVLDSTTHAVFLHVTTNNVRDQEYGSIMKSNSNGTSYVLSTSEVNRNTEGYVDFEKMQGIEGVAIINRISNVKEVNSGSSKRLKTYITHNDGSGWALLGQPKDRPKGVKWCDSNDLEECSLHLHGYTERKDPRSTYSSPSAVGLMMGTGNVGEYLGYKKEADTFITRDGGVTWYMVAEGNWMWEYGDHGSILVIVKEGEPTKSVQYSLDEGRSWKEHEIGEEMVVSAITTVPSDTSRNFLLWGKIGSSLATINMDFSGMKERSTLCKLDEQNPKADDYDLWSPSHPLSENNCLFGHVAEYHRKRPDHDCYNGKGFPHLHNIAQNCSCTREDFECDYNYERHHNGECVLVSGLEKPDPAAVCKKNPNQIEYYDITGYRRIPLSTCEGGKMLDYTSTTRPCPNHDKEFEEKHGISGAGLFFAIVLPIAAAAGVGYWVWKNWDGKFGRIRLGDGMGGGGMGAAFESDAPWIKYPVMAISGVVAVLAALPMLLGSLWDAVSSRLGRSSGGGGAYSRPFTSRSSFQRGRGDYAVVDPDEGELLGDDSDDEA
ncbi:unnamed protein product [Zymoseptoria tritici ST99CH_3D7]|uniref:Vacuolar protein sorting/targeting protein 10 n=1 Tax=Zymoseptoria tritici (strain ST99CH_3D7) TaxID=1276538 RepID=A0A1X7RG05_ZYMT9|nr:unnamed protein product [Zymoseptoria tritici ST99CH_3D7]